MSNTQNLESLLDRELQTLGLTYTEVCSFKQGSFSSLLQIWLREKHKVIVIPSAMINPKYNNRVLYSITLLEWSRSHEFYMDKSSNGYYNTYEEALLKGLLQGLEIVKIKVYGITGGN